MDALRTPDDRFADLEGWPYEPQYVEVRDGLRMHYVDEGPSDGPVVLLAHGEPTWGYLYRKMIPRLVDAGCRVVVPDFIGFGRSDKPTSRDDYTYASHVEQSRRWLDALDLCDITLFGQDWGGLVYLVHVGEQPERFSGVVAANTALPHPDMLAGLDDEAVAAAFAPFLVWFEQSQSVDRFVASDVVGGESAINQTNHRLTPGEAAGYDAPFPDESYVAGPRQFPLLVPMSDADPPASMLRNAWVGLAAFDKPFVTAFADHEDVTRGFEGLFQTQVAGAAGQAHITVPDAGHFLQEHQPDLLVETILKLVH
jgi:haloalkane dehalogenase